LSKKKLLLLSNSTNFGESYMQWCKSIIAFFVVGHRENILFIPYAAVGLSYQEYTDKVNDAFKEIGLSVSNIDDFDDKDEAIAKATAIWVGGGNTFHLLKTLQDKNLLPSLKKAVKKGTRYVGWSAGSNIASPTICTTNDMPIVQPTSFEALGFVNYQINPHYTEETLPNHGGESRKQRLLEFLSANKKSSVVCLPESTYIIHSEKQSIFYGQTNGKILYSSYEVSLSHKNTI
jgi:dipeptidase E